MSRWEPATPEKIEEHVGEVEAVRPEPKKRKKRRAQPTVKATKLVVDQRDPRVVEAVLSENQPKSHVQWIGTGEATTAIIWNHAKPWPEVAS